MDTKKSLINPIIEASIRIGIPVKCEYVLDRGFIYTIDGFYKSDGVSIETEDGKLIATARYNEKTEINKLEDIVALNYEWWEYSRDKFITGSVKLTDAVGSVGCKRPLTLGENILTYGFW